ncbi:MAG: electron transport complex subunit RsxC [Spirochaetota bacterium]
MKNLKTFPKGGVHPHDQKRLSEDEPIRNAVIPSLSVVPLLQHLGSPAEPVVKAGDKVAEGTLLGKSKGFVSAQVHSPVPGTVKELREIYLPTGIKSLAVVIELEGEFDRLGKKQSSFNWEALEPKALLDIIIDMGIVGLGGAAFPTHVKFSIPRQSKIEYFVVNGAECEPYLTSDYRLMLEKPREILNGIRVIRKILNTDEIIIGIEENKPAAIEIMEKTASSSDLPIQVVPLALKYPQGDEKQLLKALIGREVPSGGLPLDIGAVVSNVGTVFAIYEAVFLQKPLIERIVTVSGGAIKNPANLKARVGTPIGSLIAECGGFTSVPKKLLIGGPMMGFAAFDLDMPVTKGTSGVLALTAEEVNSSRQTACLGCGRCLVHCPMGLNPTRLFKVIDHLNYDTALKEGLMDCKECGCCAFVCPAYIPLVQAMKLGKRMGKQKVTT